MAILQRNNWISQKTKLFFSLDNKFWPGFIVGLFYFSWIFGWFRNINSLDSLGIHNKSVSIFFIYVTYILCVIITALWWGIAGYLSSKIAKRNVPVWSLPLVFASIFTLTEYLRSIFFSIFWYGSGGLIGPYWPFGNLSYWLADIGPLALTASFWGIYGLTFGIVYFFSIIFYIFTSSTDKKGLLGQILLLFSVFIFFNYIHGKNQKNELAQISVAVIQTEVPAAGFNSQEEILEDLRSKLFSVEEAAKSIGEGMIIFPEGSNFLQSLALLLDSSGIEKYFKDLSDKNLLIIDSFRTTQNMNLISKALLIDSKDGLINSYDKKVLTPGGEFLPYIIKIPLALSGPVINNQLKQYKEYASGDSNTNVFSYKDSLIKILICSELISPLKTAENNGDFNIVLGSFSVWNGSKLATNQALSMTRFRAIESGKYTVLASNFGPSYIINPSGKVGKHTRTKGYELLTGFIVPNKSQTWYNYLGDWPILLVSSAIFGIGIKKIRYEPES